MYKTCLGGVITGYISGHLVGRLYLNKGDVHRDKGNFKQSSHKLLF